MMLKGAPQIHDVGSESAKVESAIVSRRLLVKFGKIERKFFIGDIWYCGR